MDNEKIGFHPRALNEIFKDLKNKVASRREDPAPCECDGVHYSFVAQVSGKNVLKICPACNPRLHCKKCLGTGFLNHFDVKTMQDNVSPHQCECTWLEKRVEYFNQADFPLRYFEAQFGMIPKFGFSQEQIQKTMSKQARAYEFCDEIHHYLQGNVAAPERFFLMFMGPVGSGKTFLASAVLRRLIMEFGHAGVFVDFQRLLQQLKDCYQKKMSEEEVLNRLRTAPVLLIDEFGKGRVDSEWELEKLDDLINSRYIASRVTIITTNYLTPELYNDWIKNLPKEDKVRYLKMGDSSGFTGFESQSMKSPANESFWTQTLPERIGARMFDRIMEVSELISFVGLPSLRKIAANTFSQRSSV